MPGCSIYEYNDDIFTPWGYVFTDDSMVFRGPGSTLYCIHPEGDKYTLTIFPEDAEKTVEDTDTKYVAFIVKCAYKDGKLAVARFIYRKALSYDGTEQWQYGGLNISVISTEKIEYSAQIQSSTAQGMYFPADISGSIGLWKMNYLSW